MKKFLSFLIFGLVLCSCADEGYSTMSMTSVADFEFDMYTASFVDSLYLTTYFKGGSNSYGNLIFNSNRTEVGGNMTGGFGITAKRDSSLVIKEDNKYPQYTMYATSAASNSTMCAVYYQNPVKSGMPEHDVLFLDYNYGTCTPTSCSINNTQQTVYDVLASDDKFVQGDYLKLTITGYLNDAVTGTVEYYLADHRGKEDEPDSVLTRWRTISLTKLGDIDCIDFELSSNRSTFPNTFCLDNMWTSIYISY